MMRKNSTTSVRALGASLTSIARRSEPRRARAVVFTVALAFLSGAAAQQDRRAELERAYEEILVAQKMLRAAESRRDEGAEPLPGERIGVAGGGSRLAPEYFARQEALEKDVGAARARLDQAYRRWHEAR
jgi:hypothetical protein